MKKTVNVGDNNSVYIADTLTYTIKITNKSNVTPNSTSWQSFSIEETLGDYVEYVSVSNNGILNDNTITWTIDGLDAGESMELTYTIKVKDEVSNISKTIQSLGKFYSSNDNTVFLSTGTVENKIIPKVSKLNQSYSSCFYNYKNTYYGLELINEIYKCAVGIDFHFEKLSFDALFTKSGTTKSRATIKFADNLDEIHSNFKNMVLNNYFSGLVKYESLYYLPRWSSDSLRAKTINPTDFKDGDVLVYDIESSKFTDEEGIYAYVYIDGNFVGINGSDINLRNEFDYHYYENTNSVSEAICNKYQLTASSECNYFYNLYGGYSKLASYSVEKKESILEFVNYQTLFDKDYYVILRPELLKKEVIGIELQKPTKINYIKNDDSLDLTDGEITVIYNDGTKNTLSLTDDNVKVTGFDNSKVGIHTITVEYEGYTTTFDIEVEEIIDNPKTGMINIINVLCLCFVFGVILYYAHKYIKRRKKSS